ncbi:MAG: hypothetical protein H0W79_13135 [Rubrobacteraceae bacterium]|nr:hypothetical protein [Rubrobacteraceae bacterium]
MSGETLTLFEDAEAERVPPGYKQTEVGVIPEAWDVDTIGSLLDQKRLGGNYSNQPSETDNPLIKMTNPYSIS